MAKIKTIVGNFIGTDIHGTTALANGLPAADLPEMQAKAALRYYVSYASEGAQAVDLFAAKGGACCQLVSQNFFNAVFGWLS